MNNVQGGGGGAIFTSEINILSGGIFCGGTYFCSSSEKQFPHSLSPTRPASDCPPGTAYKIHTGSTLILNCLARVNKTSFRL